MPTKGRTTSYTKMVSDPVHGFEVARFREWHLARYLLYKGQRGSPRRMQDKTHEARRQESGMLEIEDANFIAVGDEKVVRCDIGVTEV